MIGTGIIGDLIPGSNAGAGEYVAAEAPVTYPQYFELPKIAHPDFAVPGRKPVGPVEIDWTNPLANGLVFYAAPGVSGGVDMVTGRPPESDTTQLNAGADKSRAAISGTINYGDVSGRVIGDWDEITMLCRYPVGTDVNESLLFQHERLGTKLFKVDASFDSWIGLDLLGTKQTLYNATEYSSGTLVAAADTASDNIRVYVDGKGIVDTAHTVSTYTVNSTDDIRVDVTNAGAFFGVGAVWRRRLSDADMRVLSLDPYQILKPVAPLQIYYSTQQAIANKTFFNLPKIAHSDFAVPGRKPIGPVEIDWSHPLAKGLVSCILPNARGTLDLVAKKHAESDALTPIRNNRARQDASSIANMGSSSRYALSEFTLLSHHKTESGVDNSNNYICGRNHWHNALHSNYAFHQYWETNRRSRFVTNDGSLVSDISIDNNTVLGEWGVHIGSVGGTEITYDTTWSRGDSKTISGAPSTGNGTERFYVGGLYLRQGSGVKDVEIGVVAVWNRALSAEEKSLLIADPYQILKPAIPLQLYVPSGGGTVSSFDKVFNLSLLSNLIPDLIFNTSTSLKVDVEDVINITSGLKVDSNNVLLNIYNLVTIQTDAIVLLDNIASVLLDKGVKISSLASLDTDKQVVVEALLELFKDDTILIEALALINNISELNVSWQGENLLTIDAIILLDYLADLDIDEVLVTESIESTFVDEIVTAETLESTNIDESLNASNLESTNIDESLNASSLESINLDKVENISYSGTENIDKDVNYSFIGGLDTDLVNSIESLQSIFGVHRTPISNNESVFNSYVFNIANKITSYIDKQLNTEWAGESYLDIDTLYPVDWVTDVFRDNTVQTDSVLFVYADSAYIAEINQGLAKQASLPLSNIAGVYYNNEINAEFVSKLFVDKQLPLANTVVVFNNKEFRVSTDTLLSFTAESDIEYVTNVLASSNVSVESLILSALDSFSFPLANSSIAKKLANVKIDWAGLTALFRENVHSIYFLDPRGYVYTVKLNKDTWKVQDNRSNVWSVSKSNDTTWDLPQENNTWKL